MNNHRKDIYTKIHKAGFQSIAEFIRYQSPDRPMIEIAKELETIPRVITTALLKEGVSINEVFRLSFVRSFCDLYEEGWTLELRPNVLLDGVLKGVLPVGSDELESLLKDMDKTLPLGWKPASADDPLLLQLTKGKFERPVFEGPGIDPDPLG